MLELQKATFLDESPGRTHLFIISDDKDLLPS